METNETPKQMSALNAILDSSPADLTFDLWTTLSKLTGDPRQEVKEAVMTLYAEYKETGDLVHFMYMIQEMTGLNNNVNEELSEKILQIIDDFQDRP